MYQLPIVTVICLCYNHEQFLEEALLSVINQDYSNLEIIVIDDFSTDSSVKLIHKVKEEYPQIKLILHDENKGNCKSFNEGLAITKGKYVIDFATDDVMLPHRVREQVAVFENLSGDYGVLYSNSEFIDSNGISMGVYTDKVLPSGNVFIDVLEAHVYEPSTMMVRTKFFKDLGGYNELLAYEDFDFVLRTSRLGKVGYVNEVLTQRRKVEGSHSTKFLSTRSSEMYQSTFLVCKEVKTWCENDVEKNAWLKRAKYESFLAMRRGYSSIVNDYLDLLKGEKGLFFDKLLLRLYVLMKVITFRA